MDIRYMVISDEFGYDNYRLASISNMNLLKEFSEISGCSVNPIYEEFKIFENEYDLIRYKAFSELEYLASLKSLLSLVSPEDEYLYSDLMKNISESKKKISKYYGLIKKYNNSKL